MSNSLQILLLGPPEVRWDDKLLPIQRRIPRALLFYLASCGGMVGRNELLLLFWEEVPESEARLRLSEALSRLRQTLLIPDILITQGDLVGLDFSKVYVDQQHFQSLVTQVGRTPWLIPISDPLPEVIYQKLNSVAHLWRGLFFLAGADFPSTSGLDRWLSQTSNHLEVQRGQILARLAQHAEASVEFEVALQLTNLFLQVEPHIMFRVERMLTNCARLQRPLKSLSMLNA